MIDRLLLIVILIGFGLSWYNLKKQSLEMSFYLMATSALVLGIQLGRMLGQ